MMYFITNSATQPLFGLKRLTIEEVVEKLKGKKSVAVDTETSGLSPFHGEKLLMIQLYDGTHSYIIDCQNGLDLSPLAPFFKSEETLKLFHNSKFDYQFLVYNRLEVENVYDTMLVEQCIHCGKDDMSYSLKRLLETYCGVEADKEVRDTFIGHSGDFTEEQVVYGAEDVKYLQNIAKQQMEEVERLELLNLVKLENNAVLALADMEYEGLYINEEKWLNKLAESKKEMDIVLIELNEMAVEEFPEIVDVDMFGKAVINWNSSQQTLRLFKEIDPTLQSVGAPVITPIKHKHPIIAKYLDYKGLAKRCNAYGSKFLELKDAGGKFHTNFKQILNTGRISSSKPNLQQIIPSYRECFEPSRPGWVFVDSDYTAMELCFIGDLSKQEEWIKVLMEEGDLHTENGQLIFKDKWYATEDGSEERTKLRTFGKVLSFSLAYGAGSKSIGAKLGMSDTDAQSLIDEFFGAFPNIKSFLDRQADLGEDTGLIRTPAPFKRLRSFSKWNGMETNKWDMLKIRRASTNTVIQGGSADCVKLALVYLRNATKTCGFPIRMCLQIHDELLITCPEENAEEAAKILQECMERAADTILTPGLLKASPVISNKWEK